MATVQVDDGPGKNLGAIDLGKPPSVVRTVVAGFMELGVVKNCRFKLRGLLNLKLEKHQRLLLYILPMVKFAELLWLPGCRSLRWSVPHVPSVDRLAAALRGGKDGFGRSAIELTAGLVDSAKREELIPAFSKIMQRKLWHACLRS